MGERFLRFDIAFFLLLGISCYWAWSSASLLTPSLWSHTNIEFSYATWVTNVIAHLMSLLALGAPLVGMERIIAARHFDMISALFIGAGTLLLSLGYAAPAPPVAILGSAASGAGTAMMLIIWTRTCLRIEEDADRHFLIAGSAIVSFFIVFLIANLPHLVALAVTICLPILMLCCFRQANTVFDRYKAPNPALISHWKTENAYSSPSNQSRPYFLRLLGGCFVLALPAGLYQNGFSSPSTAAGTDGWNQVMACACVLIALITFLDYAIERKLETNVFSRLAVPLMAGGLLILSISTADFSLLAGAFLQTGYYLFLIFIYTEFGTLALDSQTPAHRIVAIGTCAIDAGLLCGFGLVQTTHTLTDDWIAWAIIVVVYLLLLGGILLFPHIMDGIEGRRAKRRHPASSASGAISTHVESVEWQSTAMAAYGLSEREVEILQYLLEGRTLRAIADKTFLSYNTVKTHVSHIYRKTDVHTRDELIELIKR